ncbi:FHA domain-containing protein [Ruficoccus sp. ZRK36]|uniref:FHA domain-containing protein n=1 Tax=Ruficoccus sp. ZRK36 TaxID=2866311 RepID=UPI001C73D7D1|nr:FHA domain-containing protein [Ruficoccus sp. ZRK36]QYY37316.1 FHA domain-containing protein [Ruficoccus sp. ZRK36]
MNKKHKWEPSLDLLAQTMKETPGAPLALFDRLKFASELIAEMNGMMPFAACLAYRGSGRVVNSCGLEKVRTVVGRSESAELCVAGDRRLSRRHFAISRHGQDYTVEELGSTNGTCVNAEALKQPRLLRSGDLIEAGSCVFAFIIASDLEEYAGVTLQNNSSTLMDNSPDPILSDQKLIPDEEG